MIQHLVVLLLVVACATLVALQVVRTLRGRKGRLGNCCSRPCAPAQDGPPPPHFLPAEALRHKGKR